MPWSGGKRFNGHASRRAFRNITQVRLTAGVGFLIKFYTRVEGLCNAGAETVGLCGSPGIAVISILSVNTLFGSTYFIVSTPRNTGRSNPESEKEKEIPAVKPVCEAKRDIADVPSVHVYSIDTYNYRVQYFRDAPSGVAPTSLGRVKAAFK